jgi:hypothetical protein
MVFCKVRSGERDKANLRKKYLSHKIAGDEETPSRGRGISMNAKVRKLDVSGATGPDVARNFQNHLRQVLSSQNHNADCFWASGIRIRLRNIFSNIQHYDYSTGTCKTVLQSQGICGYVSRQF